MDQKCDKFQGYIHFHYFLVRILMFKEMANFLLIIKKFIQNINFYNQINRVDSYDYYLFI
jgi:hypothetical protein